MAAYGIRRSSYESLKALIEEESASCIQFDELKYFFEPLVGSPRRMECIRTSGDLMICLERLDFLSEYNIDCLRELAEYMENPKIQNAVAAYVTPKEISPVEPVNLYRESRLASNFHSRQYSTQANNIPSDKSEKPVKQNLGSADIACTTLTNNQRDAIYKLLSRNIGSSWRFFGRELGIGEGDMDAIELQFTNDLASRIYKLLKLFEENECLEESHRLRNICRALDACGRKDLRRKIMHMMS